MEANKSNTVQPTIAELQSMIATLQAQNAELATKNNAKLTLRISEEKGGIQLSGLGQFPTTLYKTQWERLIEHVTGKPLDITSPLGVLISKGDKFLAVKGESEETAKAKKIARMADTSGLVHHPSAESKAKNNKTTA